MLLLILLAILLLNTDVIAVTRDGRCPQPQYVSSSLPCSTEGEDDVCPSNYKCCPLIDGMKCFGPCPNFTEPCNLECPFDLKVDPSPCTVCECAPDPCLSTSCPLGTKCITQEYEPCAIKGRCGLKTQCVIDPSIHVDPTPKRNNCPDYWPIMGSGLQACRGPDALCPGKQKCCQAPSRDFFESQDSAVSYCVEPCKDISKCTRQCRYGFVIDGGCRLCRCARDPCHKIKCAADEECQLLPPPCAYYPGRPPCALIPVCIKRN